MNSSWPQLLNGRRFLGVLHCRFQPVEFPVSSTGNIRWEGEGDGAITALAEPPADANRGETFLRLSLNIGEQIDSAHLSTQLLAHWPGQVHFCFQDLVCANRYGNLFGRFVGLDDYFDHVYDPGYGDRYLPEEYGTQPFPKLTQSYPIDPISRWVRYWAQFSLLKSLEALWASCVASQQNVEPG